MRRAREYVMRQPKPALPTSQSVGSAPERREDAARRDRIDEIAANYAETDATVLTLLDRLRWLLRFMVVVVVLGFVSTAYFYDQNRQRASDNRVLAQRADALARENARAVATAQRAIVTGCELLVSAVQQVGISPSRRGESKASRLNRVLTITVIDEVLRTAPPAVQARVADLYHRLLRAGPVITLPDCQTLAELRDDPSGEPLQPRRGRRP